MVVMLTSDAQVSVCVHLQLILERNERNEMAKQISLTKNASRLTACLRNRVDGEEEDGVAQLKKNSYS